MARNGADMIADLGSVVKFRERAADGDWIRVRCCKKGRARDASLMRCGCEFIQTFERRVSGLGLMLISCWRAAGQIFFWASPP